MIEIFVNMGELATLTGTGLLTTVGLGSCVGVVLYDRVARIGGMAHVFLSDSTRAGVVDKPGKYADTAIPALVEEMIKSGSQRSRLEAKIAGGAHLFPNVSGTLLNVGQQNVLAVRAALAGAGIPLRGEDVAGNYGRKMTLDVSSGLVTVRAIGREPRSL